MAAISAECGLSEPQQRLSFEKFSVYQGNRDALEAARAFAAAPAGEWLVLTSPRLPGGKPLCGNGKTHLLAATGNALIARGVPVLYSQIVHLLDHLRAGFAPAAAHRYGPGDDVGDPFEERWHQVLNVDVLLLDDVGTQADSSWTKERLFALFDWRYQHRLATAMTTNLSAGDLRDWEERIHNRIVRYPATIVANSARAFHDHLRSGR